MSDQPDLAELVRRLRFLGDLDAPGAQLMCDAAAELDRLRATNAALEKALVDSVAARAKRLKANGAGNVDEYVAYILGQDPAEVTPYVLADAKAHHAASAALTPTPAPQERQDG